MSGNPNYVVATVGWLEIASPSLNAVPGRVELVLELRSDSEGVLGTFTESLISDIQQQFQESGISLTSEMLSRGTPTACSPEVMSIAESAAEACGTRYRVLPSGAGHDAVYASRLAPMGMVFIPCLNGRSHCPEESITPTDLANGTSVLAETLVRLDKAMP